MIVLDEFMAINRTQSHRVLFFLLPNANFPPIQRISSSSSPLTLPLQNVSRVLILNPQNLHALRSVSISPFPHPLHQDPNVNAIDRAGEMINTV